MAKVFITTSIPYVNAKPHIGFALEEVLADVAARVARLADDEVFFLTGADENGLKNYTTAQEQGISVQKLVDRNSILFEKLAKKLNLTNDNFIRTSTPLHRQTAQEFWKRLVKAGDIYKKRYRALYCLGCEAFILPRELKDNRCPNHDKKPKKIEEENYFFRLTRYKDRIYQAVKTDRIKVLPESRKNELLNLIKDAEDVSFSRPASKLPWGVAVPIQSGQRSKTRNPKPETPHTIYVWCDALVNYISGLKGKDLKAKAKIWNSQDQIVHFIGKDILRFHGSIWIGMLLSAGFRLPSEIRVHGHITSEGKKMSKSLGNVVDPFEYIKKFGADAVRFYLLKEIPEYGDGDFSRERFIKVYNNLLVNELGNLVQRSITLLAKSKAKTQILSCSGRSASGEKSQTKIKNFQKVWEEVRRLNAFISGQRLWEEGKTKELEELRQGIYNIAIALEPYLPETSQKILEQLKTLKPKILFPNIFRSLG
jgi:methionyl-tRNA synthetase